MRPIQQRFPLVKPIEGEPFRFLVQSRSRASVKHLVDMEEYDFNGFCGCETFAFRMQPLLERGERGTHLRCVHIRQVRDYFLDELLPKLAARVNGSGHTKAQREALREGI